jgi:hypothetical protein
MAKSPRQQPTCTARNVARLLRLTDDPRIRAETRARVRQTAAHLGYQPNRVARAMRTGQSPLVDIVVPSLRVSFFADLADAIERATGHRCLLAQSHGRRPSGLSLPHGGLTQAGAISVPMAGDLAGPAAIPMSAYEAPLDAVLVRR